jgi:RNA polymerase sigma factor (sigma-70 family)
VRQALARLPARQRRAVVLRYYADLSVEDTATAMGCPPGTVKTLCRRAIAALRTMGLEAEE